MGILWRIAVLDAIRGAWTVTGMAEGVRRGGMTGFHVKRAPRDVSDVSRETGWWSMCRRGRGTI